MYVDMWINRSKRELTIIGKVHLYLCKLSIELAPDTPSNGPSRPLDRGSVVSVYMKNHFMTLQEILKVCITYVTSGVFNTLRSRPILNLPSPITEPSEVVDR